MEARTKTSQLSQSMTQNKDMDSHARTLEIGKLETSLKELLDSVNLIRNMIYDIDNEDGTPEIKIGKKNFNKGKDTRKNLMDTMNHKKELIKLIKTELDGLRNNTETKGHREQLMTKQDTEETEMDIEIKNELKRRRQEELDISCDEIFSDDDIFKDKPLKRTRFSITKGPKNMKQNTKNRRNSLPLNLGSQRNIDFEEFTNTLKTQIIADQATMMKKLQEENEKNFKKLQEENSKVLNELLQKLGNIKDNLKNQPESSNIEKELKESKEEINKLKTENNKLTKITSEMKDELKKLKENIEKTSKTQKEENKKTHEKLDKINKNMLTEKMAEKVFKETSNKLELKDSREKIQKSFKQNIINKDDNLIKIQTSIEGKTGNETMKVIGGVLDNIPDLTVTAKQYSHAVILGGPIEQIKKIEKTLEKEEVQTKTLKPPGTVFQINYIDEEISTERIHYHLYSKNMKGIPGWNEEKVKESMTIFIDTKSSRKVNNREYINRRVVLRATNGLEKFLASKSKVFIGFSNCPIFPTVVVSPCVKCGSVFHNTKSCEEEKEVCWSCGNPDHKSRDCKEKKTPKCLNCIREGNKETQHYLLDEKKCIIYRKTLERAKRIAGMLERPEETPVTSKEGSFHYRQFPKLDSMETEDDVSTC